MERGHLAPRVAVTALAVAGGLFAGCGSARQPESRVARHGRLFAYGNLLQAPFRLRVFKDSVFVNGMLIAPPPKVLPTDVPGGQSSRLAHWDTVMATACRAAWRFHTVRRREDSAFVATLLSRPDVVDSVHVKTGGYDVWFRGETRPEPVELMPGEPWRVGGSPGQRHSLALGDMNILASGLEQGSLVILTFGGEISVPECSAEGRQYMKEIALARGQRPSRLLP